MDWLKQKPWAAPAAAAVAALIIGFAGGFLVRGAAVPAEGPRATAEKPLFGGLFGKPRAAGAPRAGPPRPDGFAVWRQRLDVREADAKACVEFTRPLDPSRAYGDFVLVSPDPGKPAAVAVNPNNRAELCVAGLGFFDRRLTFLKGLPAKSGQALAANADVDFAFGEKPPYVGFAGDGVILPREDSDGVGIETINVERLKVEVWRVTDRNLVRKSISAPTPTAEGEYASDYGDDSPDEDGRLVWKGDVPVKGPRGERATTVFPLGAVLRELKAGAYVIKARDASGGRDLTGETEEGSNPPAQARRWILFTDMALIAYSGEEGVDVVARSLKTAKPLSGVRVALVARDGDDLASQTTDAQGHVRFAKALMEGQGAEAAKAVMAYGPEADFTTLSLDRSPVDLSSQGMGGRPGAESASITAGRAAAAVIDAFLYSDRGVYRPGETVRLVGLLRDAEAKAVRDRPGAIVVKRPSGVEAFRFRFPAAPAGFASADIALPKSAPRGRWTAELMIDGLDKPAGSYGFSVEDFAPQRLKVDVEARADQPVRVGEKARPIAVDAQFLYGAPGAGLQVQGDGRLKPDFNPFPAYKDYRWGDEQKPFEEVYQELTATVTDGSGHAALAFDPAKGLDTAQPLKALISASVFEPGGRPVREGAELKVRTRPVYLGVKVDPGSGGGGDPLVGLDVIAVDSLGKRLAAPGVAWTLVSENWDYEWFQANGRWQWRRTARDVVVARGRIDVSGAGPARLGRRLGWGDYRLTLEQPQSRARTVIRFAAGWGAPARDADSPDTVRVSAGPGAHGQGSTIPVTIRAPYGGQAQIAVATDRILELRTVEVGKGGTTVQLKASPAWGGGAYVLVSVIQPRDPVATPKPRRALGLAYVALDPKDRRLEVALGTPEKARGRSRLTVPVQVKGLKFGQRARVTIAAVDEGILNLTRFESPDPVKWYFGKRALGVDYRDDYGRLLDPNLGAPAALNYGADEIGGEGLTTTPIKSVALWSGVKETGLDGKAEITLDAPDFNGRLRLMAVVWTDAAVGGASKAMTVREPVVADLALPRFLAPGDRFFATLELHNLEGGAGLYDALVQGRDGVVGLFRKAYRLLVGQKVVERAPLAAPASAGVGHVDLRVTGPGFDYPRRWDLETRQGWGAETRVFTALQKPGESYAPASALLAGFTPGSATVDVSYSPFRGFDPSPIAASLSRYPYGCTEQLVSSAYPWLFTAAARADDRAGRRAHPLLSAAVGRLLDRQAADGAFGLWRVGDGEADAWLGAYATDFLIKARSAGAPVPQAAIDKALSAMRLISRPDGWAPVSYRMEYPQTWAGGAEASKAATARMRSAASAYALYVLAEAGRGDLARLRWWHDVHMRTDRSPLARAQIGAALAFMGDRARAHSALRQAIEAIGYKAPDDWYQSELRDIAGVVALAYEAGETGLARSLQTRLENAVKDPDSLNTQEQARLLQAADAMVRAAGALRIEASGVTPLVDSGGARRWGVGRFADARFVNRGSGALWRTVTVRGQPMAAPPPAANGLTLAKAYFTLGGAPVDPSRSVQGDRIVVRIAGRSSQARTLPLVVDDALPAGYEIETTLSPEDASEGGFKFLGALHATLAQEARDDRYVAALSLGGGEAFQVAYVLRAVTPGDFYRPGAQARDMYRPGVFARTAGARAVVSPAG